MRRQIAWGLFFGMIGACSLPCSQVTGDEFARVMATNKPPSEDRIIARTVINLLQSQHLTQAKVDDEVSARAFKQFLRMLDPNKMYFLQSDIDELSAFKNTIDDMVQKGDTSFAYTVFRKYSARLDEVMPAVHQMIDAPQDFSVEEFLTTDRDKIEYCKTSEERLDRWRKTIKLAFLSLRADKLNAKPAPETPLDPATIDADIRKQLHSRYRIPQRNRDQLDVFELLEYYLSSVTSSLDPHSTYMAPQEKENFDINMRLHLEGIGAQLRPEDGYITVATIVKGGAADRDGRLRVGDKIVAVGQEGSPIDVDVVEKKSDDVVNLIRGKAGTKVRLTVEPKLGGTKQIYELTRAKVVLEEDAARGEILDRGQKKDGKPYRIGYLNLPSFYLDMEGARANKPNYRSTTRDVRAILTDFTAKGVDVVVVDLSKNGGGSLTEAIECTGLFIDRGPVVQVKDPSGQVTPYDDDERGQAWQGPLVVMTSKMSASASEIFAGAIKNYGRGLVVGDPATHGKGTVQTLLDIGELLMRNASKPYGGLKLTIQQFYLPDGESTQRDGVAADVILPSITAQMDIGEGDLDYALPRDRVPAQKHANYQMVNSNVKVGLQQASANRVAQSTDFEKLMRRIDLYRKRKDETQVCLLESQYMARYAEQNAMAEEEKNLMDEQEKKDQTFYSTYYTEEVLNIARDYLDALQANNLAKAG